MGNLINFRMNKGFCGLILMLSSLGLLSGCGGKSDPTPTPTPAPAISTQPTTPAAAAPAVTTTTGANSCAVGQIYTQYGCFAQTNNCQYSFAFYNGTCIPGTISNGSNTPITAGGPGTCSAGQVSTQYGCLAQGACQIGFASYNGNCVPASVAPGVVVSGGFSSGGMINAGPGAAGIMSCTAGQIYNQFGCLPQGSCQAGFGTYNGGCFQGIIIAAANGGTCQPGYYLTPNSTCIPQAQQMGGGMGLSWGIGFGYGASNYGTANPNQTACAPGQIFTNTAGCLPISAQCPAPGSAYNAATNLCVF